MNRRQLLAGLPLAASLPWAAPALAQPLAAPPPAGRGGGRGGGRGPAPLPEPTLPMTVIAHGFQFGEGPVYMNDGSILLAEIQRETITRVSPGGAVSILAEVKGGPNGLAMGPGGKLYICNNGGRFQYGVDANGRATVATPPRAGHVGGMIQRLDLRTKRLETLYDSYRGRRLRSPNDLVFDGRGGFYFTDYGAQPNTGGLYYATVDGRRIVQLADGLATPNGIGLSPDRKSLYYADSNLGTVFAYDVVSPGVVRKSTIRDGVFGKLPAGNYCDSLKVEADGRVCVGTLIGNPGITSFDKDGKGELYNFPDGFPTNLCFGGPDMRDAFVILSATGRLVKVRWPRPGLRLAYYA